MLEIVIPGYDTPRLDHLVAEFNGTLAMDGALLPDVPEALRLLRPDGGGITVSMCKTPFTDSRYKP